MGGKGYKPRKDYAGRTVSGDWEDSDRGAGNKATRRAGGEVEAKSPTYIAHVVNKGKKKVDPKKNPVVGEEKEVVSEIAGTVAKQGGKALLKNQLKRKVVRQGIKVAGKTGGRAAQGGISGAGNFFLRAPNVFKLRYRSGNKDHPFLNKFKQCFLTDAQTTYTGEGVYSTYDDRTPVSILLDLSFKEIQPIYDIDYDTTPGNRAVGY